MAYKAFVYNNWSGGQATDKKTGMSNSFANSQSMDFRKSPSQVSVLPGTRRADNNVVRSLIQNEVIVASGEMYSIAENGDIYRVSVDGEWSLFGNTGQAGAFGMSYREDQDAIYIPGTTKVSAITNISTKPTLLPGYYGESQSTYDNSTQAGFNVNSNQSGSGMTTDILTSYVEDDPKQLRYFQTNIQPISKIGVNITTKGTGDWTLVVHDGFNKELGTVTVANATLTSGAVNYFVFSTPIQVNVGPNAAQTYHYHVTSTVADGKVSSSVTNDLSTCDMELWGDRLVATKNGIHPQITFQQFECIGNGRYLSVWENLGEASPSNSAWERQKLSFPPGYEVCGLTVFNEYLVIATEQVSESGNPQEGIIFYWDGLSVGANNEGKYNYFTRIAEGSPEGINEFENTIRYITDGNEYAITSVAATPEKVRRLPGSENVYTGATIRTRVYPNMATVRHGIHLFGWPSVTGNTDIPYGVYSWGRADYLLPNSFGYSYVLSTNTQYKTDTNNLTIGMVKNFGDVLHISWRDGDSYGIDVVDTNSRPAAYSTIEQLIEDNRIVTKQKQASQVEARWLDIQDGVEIVLKYQINRGGWVYSDRFSNTNKWSVDDVPNYARFDIVQERNYELQVGIDVYCDETVTEPPTIIGVSAPFEPQDSELLV